MLKTTDLLDKLKAAYNLPSDYAIAKKLGVKPSCVSRYRNHGGTFDDSIALEVAELLELNPLSVVASMHAERAERSHDNNAFSFWREYAA
ncbi:XRE family transcriptional regulator [Neptunicella sp. SCSIO 80796]|uniref:XRE family transcriptional regulator n=1 Tax=Neptunicella plasticusilytica TaxID=3117012 RepID=UPI003A4D22DF